MNDYSLQLPPLTPENVDAIVDMMTGHLSDLRDEHDLSTGGRKALLTMIIDRVREQLVETLQFREALDSLGVPRQQALPTERDLW